MPGLILEGGTFRPIFTCGVMDALLEHDVMFDYIIGVSAGITNGYSYISRQKGRNLEIIRRYRNDKRYVSRRNLLRCRSLFGIDFVFDEIPNKLLPFDWDTFHAYPGRVIVGVTNARTGQPEYLDGKQVDRKNTMLRATCAIPLVFPSIHIGKKTYYDGGLTDPIPIRKSIADGNSRNLIILTRTTAYQKTTDQDVQHAVRILKHRYPHLAAAMLARAGVYNDTVAFCNERAKTQPESTVLLRPLHEIDSMESDFGKLKAAYDEGYALAEEQMERIQALFR